MFFIASKIFFFFLHPLHWLLVLAALWFWVKNPVWKKRWRNALLIIAILFTNGALYGLVLQCWQPAAHVQKHQGKYQTAILLTGMTMGNRQGERFFGNTSDRFIQALRLYKTGTVQHILISGGNGGYPRPGEILEADFLHQELLAIGVPANHISIEKQSRNTWESAIAAKPILDSLNATQSCILVTSALHMKRAAAVFKKAGIQPELHYANYEALEVRIGWQSFLPDLMLLNNWQFLLKEITGLVAYRVGGKV